MQNHKITKSPLLRDWSNGDFAHLHFGTFSGSARLLYAQPDLYGESSSGSLLGSGGAPVLQGDVLDDGKTKTRAAEAARTTLVDAVETLEDVRQMLLWDAGTVVGEGEEDLAARTAPERGGGLDGNLEVSGVGGVGKGVVEDVAEEGIDERDVTLHGERLRDVHLQLDVPLAELRSRLLLDLPQDERGVNAPVVCQGTIDHILRGIKTGEDAHVG